jgi:hypothetical protein
MTCERSALLLSALGVLVIAATLMFDGVTIAYRRLHFRNLGWRLVWRAGWVGFLTGIAVAAFFCGSPAGS